MVATLDSNILIYVLDDASPFSQTAQALLRKLEENKSPVFMSSIARTEILHQPYRVSRAMGSRARQLLGGFTFISYLDVTTEIADKAAELSTKAGDKLKNIDSIHLATALTANAGVFWTNDDELSKVKVEGLEIRSLRKYASG